MVVIRGAAYGANQGAAYGINERESYKAPPLPEGRSPKGGGVFVACS